MGTDRLVSKHVTTMHPVIADSSQQDSRYTARKTGRCGVLAHTHTKSPITSYCQQIRVSYWLLLYTHPSTRHDNGELKPLGQADQQLGWQESEADRRTNREFSFSAGWNYVSFCFRLTHREERDREEALETGPNYSWLFSNLNVFT